MVEVVVVVAVDVVEAMWRWLRGGAAHVEMVALGKAGGGRRWMRCRWYLEQYVVVGGGQ